MILFSAIAVATLIAVGLYLMMSGIPLRVAIGFLIFSNGVNLGVLSASGLPGRSSLPPLIRDNLGMENYVDPLPQAFVLTAIVIGLGALGFMLAMARRMADDNRALSSKGVDTTHE